MNGSLAHQVAYFSMEIALDPSIPTYAGRLGILAATRCGRPRISTCLDARLGRHARSLREGSPRMSLDGCVSGVLARRSPSRLPLCAIRAATTPRA
ncbi:MAG: hypothetical protein U0Q16_19120 [Bryobacteraceae bacterium]